VHRGNFFPDEKCKAPVVYIEVLDSLAESDHGMVTWMVDITRSIPKQRVMLDYTKGDYDAIRQKLLGINWNEYLVGDTEQ